MTKKIFFGNYKGGVGKTTTVFEIGAQLASKHKKKVLLIDLDPQCSLSRICQDCVNLKLSDLEVEETLNYALELYGEYIDQASRLQILEEEITTNYTMIENSIRTIPKHSKNGGKLDFIPTVLDMKNSRINDIADRFSRKAKNILVIAKLISDIEWNKEIEYDYILVDCPPTSNIIIQSVFLACDYYLIPTVGDEVSTDGVADYITEIESTYLKFAYAEDIGGIILKKYFGTKPKLIGVLETLYKNRVNSETPSEVLEKLDEAITTIGIKSVVSDTGYTYEGMKHLFKIRIRHLDNRSVPNNYGMPITLSNGEIHSEYTQITNALINILE